VRLHSARPPASAELGPFGAVSEAECESSQKCQHRYRDRADIHVTAAEVLGMVAAATGWVDSNESAALSWVAGKQAGKQAAKQTAKQTAKQAVSSRSHWDALRLAGKQAGGKQAGGKQRAAGSGSGTRQKAATRGGGGGGGCEDERGWHNPYGRGCDDYARRVTPAAEGEGALAAGGWCEGGRLKPEAAWAGGGQFGWPEWHCCACGRGTASQEYGSLRERERERA